MAKKSKPLVGAHVNFKDPRYQRMEAESYATKGNKAVWNTDKETAAFAGQQYDLRYDVANKGLQSKLAMAQEDQHHWLLKQKKKEANKREKMIPLTVGVGLFTTGATMYQQHLADQRAAKEAALKEEYHQATMAGMAALAEAAMRGRG